MKKLVSLLLTCLLLCSPALAAGDPMTAEDRYDRMESIVEFIRYYGLESSPGDDPVRRALLRLFEDEEAYNLFMDAMLSSYDRYTHFIPAGDYETSFPSSDDYVGIGVTIQNDGGMPRILEVSEGGPAQKAGLRMGDLLLSVDGVPLSEVGFAEASALLRGVEGTDVEVEASRAGRTMTFVLTRAAIELPNFRSRVVEDGVYYMDWNHFYEMTAYYQFVFAVREMTDNNCRALILDLRGNGGGELNMAYSVINHLLPEATVFFSYGIKDDGRFLYDTVESEGIGPALNKIIILCDGDSASASEVVQASLCDLGYAVSVGEQTFGKARGQYHMTFPDQSAAVLTSVELIAPLAVDYDEVGLTPDFVVHNFEQAHPAAGCQPVPRQNLFAGLGGDGVLRLNAALSALGYLDESHAADAFFSLPTLSALLAFRQDYGLAPLPYFDAQCADVLNAALDDFSGLTVEVDAQYEKALELAREYAAQPQQYTVDKFGEVTNLPRD